MSDVTLTAETYRMLDRDSAVLRRLRWKLAMMNRLHLVEDAEREYDEQHGLTKEKTDAA